jgi:phosphohistidine phosphatase
MKLSFLRHAIAVDRGTAGYEKDSERPLTKEGEKKMRRIARGMPSIGLSFDLVLSSPFIRARRTAEIVAETFGIEEKLALTPHLETGGDPRRLVEEIASRSLGLDSVLLVGHEPYLSGLISVLLGGDQQLAIVLKKGGLCQLQIEKLMYGRCAQLEFLLTPRQLRRIR